jgi:aminoacrylate hydrolase
MAPLRLRSISIDAMPRLEVAGGSVHYDSAGRGEAVLLIPGLSGLASFWQAQIEAFSPHFRTISFDHRGVGRSEAAPPYAMEQWAADIIAILDHLGIDRAHLVGHSTGSVIAQVVAASHPQRVASVILSGTWAEPDERFLQVFALRRAVLTALGNEAYAVLGAIMIAPPAQPMTPALSEPTDPRIVAARIDVLLCYHGRDHLREIRCPALVLAAADDVLIPAVKSRLVAEAIAGAELKIFTSGSHAFPRSMATSYNQSVLKFLARHRQLSPVTATAAARQRRGVRR